MTISKKFVVYELNKVMGSERHKALEKTEFKGWRSNGFDTEEEAIQALIDDEKTYEDYVILKQIYICKLFKNKKTIMKKLLLLLVTIISLNSCTSNFSEGERVGIITKFSNKGMIWKSWEGDLKVAPNVGNGGMVGQYEDFYFSIDNDNTITCITPTDTINEFMKEGIPVVVIYQQVKNLNIAGNRGDTDYFIREVKRAK